MEPVRAIKSKKTNNSNESVKGKRSAECEKDPFFR